MNDKLKPCPFCGGEPMSEYTPIIKGVPAYKIYCANNNCDVRVKTKWCVTKKEAIEAWNRRVNENDIL